MSILWRGVPPVLVALLNGMAAVDRMSRDGQEAPRLRCVVLVEADQKDALAGRVIALAEHRDAGYEAIALGPVGDAVVRLARVPRPAHIAPLRSNEHISAARLPVKPVRCNVGC